MAVVVEAGAGSLVGGPERQRSGHSVVKPSLSFKKGTGELRPGNDLG